MQFFRFLDICCLHFLMLCGLLSLSFCSISLVDLAQYFLMIISISSYHRIFVRQYSQSRHSCFVSYLYLLVRSSDGSVMYIHFRWHSHLPEFSLVFFLLFRFFSSRRIPLSISNSYYPWILTSQISIPQHSTLHLWESIWIQHTFSGRQYSHLFSRILEPIISRIEHQEDICSGLRYSIWLLGLCLCRKNYFSK